MLNFERDNILTEAHGGAMGGPYASRVTAQKNLCTGLWWPALHKNSKAYCKTYDACERMGIPSRWDEFPLHPQVSLQRFEKWAIDFVGPIYPPRKKIGVWYIITMRWAKAQPVKDSTGATAKKKLFKCVLTRFGCRKC